MKNQTSPYDSLLCGGEAGTGEVWTCQVGYVELGILEVAEATEWLERAPEGYQTEHFRFD